MRLAATIKLGYYPTPDTLINYLAARLTTTTDQLITCMDPCAGTGRALALATANINNRHLYTIEPERERFLDKTDILDLPITQLNSSLEDTTIAHSSTSLLYLNPPYDQHYDNELDTDQPAKTTKTIRKEIYFLRRCLPYLAPGGLLIFIVPEHILTPNLAEYLSTRLNNIEAFRFPEPEYSQFKQIIITGNKKQKPEPEPANFELTDFVPSNLEPYTLPTTSHLKLFKTYRPDPEELDRLWTDKQDQLLAPFKPLPTSDNATSTPPLPLHLGHLSLLLAAGHINGLLGQGPDRHVVRGTVIKKTAISSAITPTENGSCETTTRRDCYTVSIKTLHPDGHIEILT